MPRSLAVLLVALAFNAVHEVSAYVSVSRNVRLLSAPAVQGQLQVVPRRVRQTTMAIEAVWGAYTDLLVAKPLITKCVTASVIIGAGDAAAQAIEKMRAKQLASKNGGSADMKRRLDYARVLRWAFFGLVLQAPWNHYFFLMLDNALPPPPEPFSPVNLLKVGVDQLVQSPIFTGLCFVFLSALEGKTIADIREKLRSEYKGTILTSWKLWIPAAFVNIGFVPPPLRVLFINTVFFFWTVYLSLVVNKPVAERAS